jgi:hypothetical protein
MKILDRHATWFVIGAVVMYFAFPYVAPMLPSFGQKSQ